MSVEKFFESVVRDALVSATDGATVEDVERLIESDGFKDALDEAIPRVAATLADTLVERSPAMLSARRGAEARIADQVHRVYGRGIDLCEAVLRIATELGAEWVERHPPSEAGMVPVTTYVVAHLQARACRISEEALVLAKTGFGLGALSRWRALHEVTVVSSFIAEHGATVATRYVEHLTVEQWRQLSAAAERASRVGEQFDVAELSSSRADVDALRDRYGDTFLADYGWAADALAAIVPPPPHGGFRAIEAATDLGHLRFDYRRASAAIHAGPAFVLEPPDAYHFGSALLSGPSLVGLATPVHSVAISLVQVTAAMMTLTESWAAPFVLKTMLDLSDRTGQVLATAEADTERSSAA